MTYNLSPPEPYQVWADRYFRLESELAALRLRIDGLERQLERYVHLVEGIKLGLTRQLPSAEPSS